MAWRRSEAAPCRALEGAPTRCVSSSLCCCWPGGVWAAFRHLARHHRGLDTSWFGPCARQRPGSPPRIRRPARLGPPDPSPSLAALSHGRPHRLATDRLFGARQQRGTAASIRSGPPLRPWGAARARQTHTYASRAYDTSQWSTTTVASSCVVYWREYIWV